MDAFLVASANFGGGLTSASLLGDAAERRVAGLTDLAAHPRGGAQDPAASVLAVQEMVSLPGRDGPLAQLVRAAAPAAAHFTSITSTDRYPLASKWERRWEADGPLDADEGLATLAFEPAGLRAATGDHRDPAQRPGRGRAIDLPMLEFSDPAQTLPEDDSWLRASVPWLEDADVSDRELLLRPTYYQGSRDTEPRAASAHVASLPSAGSPTEVVVVNVHLATLRSEAAGERPVAPGDELAFALRRPSVEATYLRHRQFEVLAAFIRWVYAELRLPVVVTGDFNCEPGSPELDRFCAAAALTPALRTEACWRCGTPVTRQPARRYANRSFTRISEQPAEGLLPVTSDGYCAAAGCAAPLFTHKRNLMLLDNVLATDPASEAGRSLTTRLALAPPPGGDVAAGINDTHDFSDHNSVWASFAKSGP